LIIQINNVDNAFAGFPIKVVLKAAVDRELVGELSDLRRCALRRSYFCIYGTPSDSDKRTMIHPHSQPNTRVMVSYTPRSWMTSENVCVVAPNNGC
ncbi:MAG: hypothetical protein WB946_08510, partial [Halobacteriota archaeon]